MHVLDVREHPVGMTYAAGVRVDCPLPGAFAHRATGIRTPRHDRRSRPFKRQAVIE